MRFACPLVAYLWAALYAKKLFALQNGDKYWKKHLTAF